MRFLSLNVERSAHLDRFIPFLRDHSPDVACLQELVESDIAAIQDATDLAHCHFVPMGRFSEEHAAPFGVGILSRHAFLETNVVTYAGGGNGTQVIDRASPERRYETIRYAAAWVRTSLETFNAPIATTHFPWTANGEPTDFQYQAVEQLISVLGNAPILLCGDFNAPRGGQIFGQLAEHWRDRIPGDIETSIDPDLHRAGALQLMVDGLFASPDIDVRDVCMHQGVSDHKAITATVVRS